jgi:hypothetical protein
MGTKVLAALSPSGPGSGRPRTASSSRPKARELAEAEERAVAIVAELREGRCDLLGADMLAHIPKSWPDRILHQHWPQHVERWGAVREHRSLGAFFDPVSGRTRVWIRLDQARGERSVEIAFMGGKLNIFDLKARDFPVEVGVAPIDDRRLVGFDFKAEAPYELTLKGKGKSRALELRTRGGSKLKFRPEKPR